MSERIPPTHVVVHGDGSYGHGTICIELTKQPGEWSGE
jgi:hypothetical protein